MPQSESLNPVFPILSPFNCNILKKDQEEGWEEVRSDPLSQDQVFQSSFMKTPDREGKL